MQEIKKRQNQTKDPVILPKSIYSAITKTREKTGEETQVRLFLTLIVSSALLVLFVVFFGEYGVISTNQLSNKEAFLKQRITEMEQEIQKLNQRAIALRTNADYIESQAKKDLGLVRKDEVIFLIPPELQDPLSKED